MSSGHTFQDRYNALNPAQKQAVDTIDGPLMVVAGPGTGKTELLSVRVANILKRTDAGAENILCLTFTESGASAMRARLAELMGKDAYRVSVHTFHGFGSEIINTQPDYFYSGAEFQPSDDLSTHGIVSTILSKLPHDNPLSKRLNHTFTQLRAVLASISDFKRSGLTPDEIQRLVRAGEAFIDFSGADFGRLFASKPSKTTINDAVEVLKKIQTFQTEPLESAGLPALGELCASSLAAALDQAETSGKTTALTAWRSQWFEKNSTGEFVFKEVRRHKSMLAASHVYGQYLKAMQEAQLYDYDDMILRVVHALEVFPDMRYNLQERYQYILCDEFQDTNGAQMRILHSLISGSNEGRPNIMVVGDDDQAIYRFQGAEVNNVLDFQNWMQRPAIITLKENYRSTDSILKTARRIIQLGTSRLENLTSHVNKELHANRHDQPDQVRLEEYASSVDQYASLSQKIKLRQTKQPDETIAVLARNHRDIAALAPYLESAQVEFSYERRDNVFDDESVKLLLSLAQLVDFIASGAHHQVDVLLAEVLAHPAWGLSANQLWQISLASYQNQQTWLETMLGQPDTSSEHKLAQWLIEQARLCRHQPLEHMLDNLLGASKLSGDFVSPLKQYFFSKRQLQKNNQTYIRQLQALSSLRQAVRQHQPQASLKLSDITQYVNSAKAAGIKLENHYQAQPNSGAVVLMTAHKAKGLEFDNVFIIDATDKTWGSSAGGRSSRLSYPANFAIGPAGDNYDDRLRLFFVAATRAKTSLNVSYSTKNAAGKDALRADFLSDWQPLVIPARREPAQQLQAAQYTWHLPLPKAGDRSLKQALTPLLNGYMLSATHLNNFIDVSRGGPQTFLLNNLLHFPEAISASAALGSAVHKTLQRAGAHLGATRQQRPLEDLLYDFETNLKTWRLSDDDFAYQLQRGSEALSAFLTKTYDTFKPDDIWEFNFKHQNVALGEARLTGMIDVISSDKTDKTITVSDYKTGAPVGSWTGKTDWEKIKLHKYRQQLLFYKLLIENARQFHSHKVSTGRLLFVEPNKQGSIVSLEMSFDKDELQKFQQLIAAVWRKIANAEFTDTSQYSPDYKGILQFEKDLLL